MCDFVSKSLLFREVDTLHLEEMNCDLWRKASLDATSSRSNRSDSPADVMDSFLNRDSQVSTLRRDLLEFDLNASSSSKCDSDQDHLEQCSSPDSKSDCSNSSNPATVASTESPTPPAALALSPSAPAFYPSSTPSVAAFDLCTINMDMTYEDRVFFGVHNFQQLKSNLLETQCNVDFSAADNKVSIIGQVPNVHKMCELFIASSTIWLQIDFRVFNEKYLECLRNSFPLFHQQCEQSHRVFVSYRMSQPDTIVFSFISFRNNGVGLIRAIVQLQKDLECCQIGEFVGNIVSSMQIPANRRDLTGRGNSFIEQIQKQTQTKVDVVRYDECSHYPFENVIISGKSMLSVMQARFELIARFSYELKFQIYIQETRSLVEYIAKLSSELNAVFISIEPCTDGPNMKTISISGNEKCIGKLFALREQILEEVKKCNGSLAATA